MTKSQESGENEITREAKPEASRTGKGVCEILASRLAQAKAGSGCGAPDEDPTRSKEALARFASGEAVNLRLQDPEDTRAKQNGKKRRGRHRVLK
jgi:hypothetical protein